eukprot:1580673-Rhodomonas_salina.2
MEEACPLAGVIHVRLMLLNPWMGVLENPRAVPQKATTSNWQQTNLQERTLEWIMRYTYAKQLHDIAAKCASKKGREDTIFVQRSQRRLTTLRTMSEDVLIIF